MWHRYFRQPRCTCASWIRESARRGKIVYLAAGDQQFVAPDNGLLSLVTTRLAPQQVIAVESRRYWREPVSSTFHGRDIMAPVAAHVGRGVEPRQLGSVQANMIQLDWPAVSVTDRSVTGTVLVIDHFGNLITNITRSMLPAPSPGTLLQVVCDERPCDAFVQTYGAASAGELVALFGSSDRLEIAVTNGSAAQRLQVPPDCQVHVTW